MATKITDLDEILGEDKKVRAGGKVYVLPPDLPVELYLRIQRLADGEADNDEILGVLYDEVLDMFRYKQPDLKKLPLTMQQLVVAIATIYGDDTAAEPEPERPPRRKASGTATRTGSSRSQKTKSRS